jgi:hypothetical protein
MPPKSPQIQLVPTVRRRHAPLHDAFEHLTQQQIRDQWPEDFPKPDQGTISRELHRGLEQGLILRQGSGRKNDPYRYWLPGKEDDFRPGPNATKEEVERYDRRCRVKFYEAIGMDPALAAITPPAVEDANPKPRGEASTSSSVPSVSQPGIAGVQSAGTGSPRTESALPLVTTAFPEPIERVSQTGPAPSPATASTLQVRPAEDAKLPAAGSPVPVVAAQEPDTERSAITAESAREPAPEPASASASPPRPVRPALRPETSLEEQRVLLRMWPGRWGHIRNGAPCVRGLDGCAFALVLAKAAPKLIQACAVALLHIEGSDAGGRSHRSIEGTHLGVNGSVLNGRAARDFAPGGQR